MGSKSSKNVYIQLDDITINDLVAKTQFSREQLAQMHTQFINECPNGRLSKKNFIKMFTQMQPSQNENQKANLKYFEYIFRALDVDDSESIDFSEFIIAFSMISPGSTKEKICMAFRIFDLDHDGKLNKKEMLKVFESLYNLNSSTRTAALAVDDKKAEIAAKARVDLLFKKLDEDGNHYITMDEFFKACLNDPNVKKFLIDGLYRYA